jgi:hypothetical protein
MHAKVERPQDFTKSIVSLGRIVLDQVAGDQHALSAPITGQVVIKDLLQGMGGNGAAQRSKRIREQVGVGQVQYPNRLPVSFLSGHLNKVFP